MSLKTRMANVIESRMTDGRIEKMKGKNAIAAEKEAGKQARLTQKQQANIEFRNKITDVMLEDEETRRALVEGARETASFMRSGIKFLGISVVIAIACWGGYKIYDSIRQNKAQSDEIDAHTKDMDRRNLTYSEDEYKSFANTIYRAFDPDSSNGWFSRQNYQEDTIISVLKKMKNKDDWGELVRIFNVRKNEATGERNSLIEFLREDDPSDKAVYQKILDDIGVFNVLN